MYDDIEFGRALVHGVVYGAASAGHDLTRADPELTPDEREAQHLTVFGLQLLGHALVEIGAAAVQAWRENRD